jgi:hypothetical protein
MFGTVCASGLFKTLNHYADQPLFDVLASDSSIAERTVNFCGEIFVTVTSRLPPQKLKARTFPDFGSQLTAAAEGSF